jgi:hypothetical protein
MILFNHYDSTEQITYDMVSKWVGEFADGWRRTFNGEGTHSYGTFEKSLLIPESYAGRSAQLHRRLQFSREKLRLNVGLFLGSVVVTLIIITHSYPSLLCDSEAQAAELESVFHGGQAQAKAFAAAPSPIPSGVLKCFQVYQPVLTPSGPSDDTVSEDGSPNTITIEPWAPTGSCTKLVMEHSFGFSYGHPFVGMCSW